MSRNAIIGLLMLVIVFNAKAMANDTIYIVKYDTIRVASSELERTDSISSNVERNSFGAKLRASHFHLGLEIQTKYMWRGIEYGTAPALFPQLSYNNWGLNVYAMGVYAVNGSHSEVDCGISYTFYDVSIGVNDYYYPSSVGSNDQYFNLKGKETGHWVEACVSYYPQKLPFWILVSTYIAGADRMPGTNKNAYSSYAEIGLHYDFLHNHQIAVACGAALNKSFYNDYEKGFTVCNILAQYTYNVNIKSWILPLKAAIIFNPYRNKAYFNLSAYFGF